MATWSAWPNCRPDGLVRRQASHGSGRLNTVDQPPGALPGRTPETRVSEAERDRSAALLAKHCSEGRLTLDEFSQRVEVVLAARTQADLDTAMRDLPVDAPPYQSPLPPSSSLVAVFGGASRRGRWRPGPKVKAIAVFGGVDLDLRNAEIDAGELEITTWAVFGGIDIVVPEGVAVHLSGGFTLFGGKDLRLADVPLLPGAPLIKVRAFPIFGGVSVRTKRTPHRMIDDLRSVVDARVREVTGGPGAPAPSVGAGSTPRSSRRREPMLDARDAIALAGDILEVMFPRSGAARALRGEPRTAPDGNVTILFSDVSGFTQLTERLGDRESHRLLETYFQIVRGQIAAHGGYEVKCHGDEAMLAFGDPSQAIRCAVDIQRSMVRYNARGDGDPIRVHIGMHTGEAIQNRGDFLGRTVILASRITDTARADEILVSSVLYDATSGSPDLVFGEARTVELQGVSDSQRLFPVLWS